MGRLQGKRTIITGGTSGIGLETAKQFVAEGAGVIVTGSSDDSLARAREVLGDGVGYIKADSGDVAAQNRVAEEAKARFGLVDAVFLNAGMGDFRPVGQWDEESFDRSFAVNTKGPFFLIQALKPILNNPSSLIINGSINAHIGMATSSVYAATKAALISLARTISGELIGQGIRVNAISPGPIRTPMHFKAGISEEDAKVINDSLTPMIPARRFGEPSEIAKTAVFLASDEASFFVGAEFLIDGGMHF